VDAERILLWLCVGGLGVGCALVLLPFVSALLWAGILVFTTWPVFGWLRHRARLGRVGAALAMVLLTAVLVVLPIALAAPESEASAARLRLALLGAIAAGLPPAPPWLAALPLAGPGLAAVWNRWAADFSAALAALQPYLGLLLEDLLRLLLGIVRGVVMFGFALFIAFFFYVHGDPIAARLRGLLARIAGARGERLLVLVGVTVRGVVYGLLGTAVMQGLMVAIGLWLAGVPRPWLLGAVAGFLSLLPIGAPVVWIPAAIWLLANGALARGLFLALYGIVAVSGADSVVRPWFIARGAELPYLLTVLGVLGGVIGFGLLGIFLGPVLLGVGYTLVKEWSSEAVARPAARPAVSDTEPGSP
jgi:predicted PurR-regulated permease PerM